MKPASPKTRNSDSPPLISRRGFMGETAASLGLAATAVQLQGCAEEPTKNRVVVVLIDSGVNFSYVGGVIEGDAETEIRHGTAMAKLIRERSARCVIHSISTGDEWDASGAVPQRRISYAGYLGALAKALRYINEHPQNAFVVNISLGSSQSLKEEHALIRELHRAGAVIVAAVANSDTPTPTYPAAYDEVVAVTNATEHGKVPDAAWGTYIDLAAPGTEILRYRGLIAKVPGTSCSAALTSGLVAELLIKDATLNPAMALGIVQRSADPIHDDYFTKGLLGAGVVNIGKAYRELATIRGAAGRGARGRLWIHGVFAAGVLLVFLCSMDDLRVLRLKEGSRLSREGFDGKLQPILKTLAWCLTYLVVVGAAFWGGLTTLWMIVLGFVMCQFAVDLSLPTRVKLARVIGARRVPRAEAEEISRIVSRILARADHSCLSIHLYRFLKSKMSDDRFWVKEERRISDIADGLRRKKEAELLSYFEHLPQQRNGKAPDAGSVGPLMNEVLRPLGSAAIPALARIVYYYFEGNADLCRQGVSILRELMPAAAETLAEVGALAGSTADTLGLSPRDLADAQQVAESRSVDRAGG